jgi:hypothetical protein
MDTLCGYRHEIDPDSGLCVVWDERNRQHLVPHDRGECACCGTALHRLQARWPYNQ